MLNIYRFLGRSLAALSLMLLVACVSEVTLQTGLTEADANEIITLLKRHGISASKARGKDGVALSVREGQMARAAELMQSAGLPKRQLAHLGQVFKKEGMISTPLEERARYLHGLSQELEYTLSQIDGVVMARVHIVLPERVAPGEPVQPSSASVFLKYQGQFDEDIIIPRVKRLVVTSIPGLIDESGQRKLSVVLLPSQSIDAPTMEWQQVGPFMVEASSADKLKAWSIAGVSICAVLLSMNAFFGTHYFIAWNKKRLVKKELKRRKEAEEALKKLQEEEKEKKRSGRLDKDDGTGKGTTQPPSALSPA